MTRPPSRVPVLLVLVWLGGLLAATSVGLLAVRLVAVQVGDPAVAPLSAVAAASAGASSSGTPAPSPPSPTSSPSPSPSPSPPRLPPPSPATVTRTPVPPVTGATATRTVATAAGTVGVQCVGTGLRLLYATPAQGYALDERSVTGAQAEVRFEGAGTRVRVRLSCATGAPRLVEQRTDPAGGGGGDDRVDRDDSVRDTDGGGGSRDDRDREDRDRDDSGGGDGDD